MKIKYPAVIVVEGATDEALLLSFLDADIVKTNGSAVPRETIDYLKKLSVYRDIVVLTDPDYPGERIRTILNNEIDGLFNAFVPKFKSIKKGKVGVAESDKKTILDALEHLVLVKKRPSGNLAMKDLVDLGLMGNEESEVLREKLGLKLSIGHANAKTFLKRLNCLGITKEELKE